jgi:hypothetical protein
MMAFRRFCATMVFLSCISCSLAPKPVDYKCASIELPPDPTLAVSSITATSPPDYVVKAWVATTLAQQDWIRDVRTQISDSQGTPLVD